MVGIGHFLLDACLLSALAIGVRWEFVPYRFIIAYGLFSALSSSAELACNIVTVRAGYPGTSERFQCSSACSPEVTSVSSQLFSPLRAMADGSGAVCQLCETSSDHTAADCPYFHRTRLPQEIVMCQACGGQGHMAVLPSGRSSSSLLFPKTLRVEGSRLGFS